MEWYQVVKLTSATIPCFFRLLFIERKRQGLIWSRNRLDRVSFGLIWLRLSARCVCMKMDANDAFAFNLPPFLPPLSPTTPITPYNPPNSPLKQINCLRPPRQNSAATATTENDNRTFSQRFFPPRTLYLQSYTVSQQSRP